MGALRGIDWLANLREWCKPAPFGGVRLHPSQILSLTLTDFLFTYYPGFFDPIAPASESDPVAALRKANETRAESGMKPMIPLLIAAKVANR